MSRVNPVHATGRRTLDVSRRQEVLQRLFRDGSISRTIQHEHLEEKSSTRLRALIVGRQILPGERIPVDHLAREMAVSWTPTKRTTRERDSESIRRGRG
jgi:hypothetical protein